MNIPASFTCGSNEIKVVVEDKLPDNNYGYWCDAKNEIHLAKYLEVEIGDTKEDVKLTQEQTNNTFYHELIHCFQFYAGIEISEAQAQVFANFMCEFFKSLKYNN